MTREKTILSQARSAHEENFMPGSFAHAPLRHFQGDFWTFWSGETISTLGSSVTSFALPLLVFKLTNSPLNLALTMAFTVLPYLLFGLAIGAWVDHTNHKRVMVFTDCARVLVIASIPLLTVLGLLSVWWIYVVWLTLTRFRRAFDGWS